LNGIETITGFDRVRRTSARHIFELLISGKQISMATLSQVELTALGCAFNKAISNGLSDVDVTLAVRVNWDAPAEAVIDICVQSYPRNLVSKKPYRGVNLFLLSATKYVSPFWLTMKQANQLGGSVRKGEHSQIVVFWKIDQLANGKSEADSEEHETDDKTRRRFVLRYYRLFNLEQCELPQAVLDKLPKIETHQHDPIDAAERIIAGMPNPPEIQYAGSKAFYSPITDRITLPPRELFVSAEEHFATLAHEIGTVASVLDGRSSDMLSRRGQRCDLRIRL